jgi:hypothetical protein
MAVTYYNQTVLGGTSYPRYADPLVTGKSNADGLYPWSTVRARFATYDAATGVVTASLTFADDTPQISLLLFASDIPAAGYIAPAATGLPVTTVAPSASVGTTTAAAFFKATPGGTNVTVSAGQVGVGYSYNSSATTDANKNIYVAGFPVTVNINVGIGTEIVSPELKVWTNSPNISSPVSFQNWDTVATATAATSGALPIVLLYSDYTQAIRDAGNIIVNTASPIGATYQVVGLYSIVIL